MLSPLRLAALLILPALAVAPACTVALVDATVDEVCLTYPNLKVPAQAAHAAGSGGAPSVAQSFVLDNLAAVHQLLQYDADLQFVRAQITTSEPGALAGIASAAVGMAPDDPGATLPHTVVYACDGDCAATVATLDMPAATVTNALAYLSSQKLAVDLSATGALPKHEWTMDVAVCVSGHAQYSLTP